MPKIPHSDATLCPRSGDRRQSVGRFISPAALPVGAHSSLVELADGGGFTVGWVVREQTAASLPAHTVEEVPETQHTCYTC